MTKNATIFFQVAEEFCQFIEGAAEVSETEKVHRAISLLGRLVAYGVLLPLTTPGDTEVPTVKAPAFIGFKNVDYYSTVFNPLDVDAPDVIMGSLDDDIHDIYVDLKGALLIVAEDENTAVWRAKQMFMHWGKHAIGALGVLHQLATTYPPNSTSTSSS